MGRAALWVVAAVGLLACGTFVAAGSRGGAAERVLPAEAAGGLLATHVMPLGDTRQQLTVVDPQMRVVSVYHIDTASGAIVLKSVRNIHWDMQMVEFNGSIPSPREIRALLEQR